MKKSFLLTFAVIFLLVSSVLFGCAKASTPTPTATKTTAVTTTTKTATPTPTPTTTAPIRGGTLRWGTDMFPQVNLGWVGDPFNQVDGLTWSCVFFDSLLNCDYQGVLSESLVTDWQVAPDLKSITLTLRQGVKFHDGSDWNATVAKWNLDLLINGKVGYWVKVASASIVDNYTIRLDINEWSNSILSTMSETRMASKAAYDAHGANKDAEEWMRWHPVGTGPFKFESFTPDVSLKGVRFDDYWQKGKPHLDAIEFTKIVDQMTRASSFTAGEMDVTDGDLSKVEYDLKQKGVIVSPVYLAICTLSPDSKNPDSPLAKREVREAIDYAINREEIVNTLGYGWWTVTYQFALPGTSSYITNLQPRNYNVSKARQLMEEAGLASGFHTEILGNSSITNRDVMVSVQGYLSQIGITADLNFVDNATFWGLVMQGWEGLCGVGLMASSGDMNLAISGLFSQTVPTNASLLKTDEFQALLDAASTAPKYDTDLTKKVIQYMFDNAMVIPIYCIERGALIHPYVHDLNYGNYIAAMYFDAANAWMSK